MTSLVRKDMIKQDDITKLIDLIYMEEYWLYKHQYESFHYFIEEIIFKELIDTEHYFFEITVKDFIYRNRFVFSKISLKPPINDFNDEIMFPEHARIKNLSYMSKLLVDVKQVLEIVNINTNEVTTKIINEEKEVPIAKIPIMVKSKYCTTLLKRDIPNTECKFDPGCYFIINGNEKVILSLERICENKLYIFMKKNKDKSALNDVMYEAQINSKFKDISENIQITRINMKKDLSFTFTMPSLQDIPVVILLRALGIVTDGDIIKYIVYDTNDYDMINVVKKSLETSIFDPTKPASDVNRYIKTQDDAIKFLMNRIRQKKSYTESDKTLKEIQKKMHLMKVLTKDVLPHLGENLTIKAYYIGYMIHKLILCYLQRIKADDRDNYINKRIETPGILLGQLFRKNLKKMINDCGKFFLRKNHDVLNPINIINQIKPSTIEQGLKSALLTGNWGGGAKAKKGVAQVLQRYTFTQTISYLRRILTPINDASTNKITSIRHINNIQYGYLCPIESPDGGNVGIMKHLSLSAVITIRLDNQIDIIKNILEKDIVDLTKVHYSLFKKLTKFFINGDWIGLIEDSLTIVRKLKEARLNNIIEKSVGIVYDSLMNEIRVFCDGGRIYRPLLRVDSKSNDLYLKPQHLEREYTNLTEFMIKNKEVIEYIDVEESEGTMIALNLEYLQTNKEKMSKTVEAESLVLNRKKDTYIRYSHCEFHPAMLLGIISGNTPLSDHNEAPRNIFNFGHCRQGMGIPVSNHRFRVDNTYMLYNPQRPLVSTFARKYVNMDDLPGGENIIIAIMSYTGYNQEDSIIMNKSSVDRGLFRSSVFKKVEEEIKKNQSTSQDDKFMKPDRNLTIGMKDGNYDKLNEQGYVPEETEIVDGDIIIGKVSPIQATINNKIYKDSSHIYRSNVKAVVDTVYTDIINSDGQEGYKMKLRSERIPVVGDKFSLDDTHDVLTNKGWKNITEITLQDKLATLNPETKCLEYHNPTRVQKVPHKGQMYLLDTRQISLCCTLDHKMYIRTRDVLEYKLRKAQDIFGKRVMYKKNAINNYPDTEYFIIPGIGKYSEMKVNMDHWLDLLGIYIADGCVSHNSVYLSGHKQRKIDHIRDICTKMNLNFKIKQNPPREGSKLEYSYDSRIYDKQIANYFIQYDLGAPNKYLPSFVWELSQRQCNILLDSLISCDGHTRKDNNFTSVYYTTSKKLADDIVRLTLHAGISANIKMVNAKDTTAIISGKLIKRTSDLYLVYLIKGFNEPCITPYKKSRKNGQLKQYTEEYIDFDSFIYCIDVPNHIMYIRRNGLVCWTGNSSNSAQKGTIGLLLHRSDMPFTKSGLVPDIILNPHALPSRMTIALPLEILLAQFAALTGKSVDGSPFGRKDFSEIGEALRELGFNEHCTETMYCGFTGRQLEAKIFIGPIYYLRLKQLVQDKIHARARGSKTIMTRQAPEGRSKDGGLRLGEMERDACISHGISVFLKEKFMESGDRYETYVCNICGLIATKYVNKQLWYCTACKNQTEISKISVPYAFKLMVQELQAINILPRIFTKE